MEKLVLAQEEQKEVLEVIKEFKSRIDESFESDKKSLPWADLRNRLNPILEKFNISSSFAMGQGVLPSDFCSIGFFRDDLDSEKYPTKIGQGFYIWLGYILEDKSFELHFGSGCEWDTNLENTNALKHLKEIGVFEESGKYCFNYKNFETLEKSFIQDFLTLVAIFNSCKAQDFL